MMDDALQPRRPAGEGLHGRLFEPLGEDLPSAAVHLASESPHDQPDPDPMIRRALARRIISELRRY
jgi:hypothetical protein